MNFSKFQKELIKVIVEYHPSGIDIKFKELLEHIFNNLFYNTEIVIDFGKIIFYNKNFSTEDFLREKGKFIEFIKLFESIHKDFFYNTTNINNTENRGKAFCFNKRNMNEQNTMSIHYNTNIILNNLYSDFYIPSELIELKKRNFESNEQINLKYTRRALYTNIVISLISIGISIYSCIEITKIEVVNPQQLKTEIIFKN